METTAEKWSWERTQARAAERGAEDRRREDELATLFAHLSAATARFVELAREFQERVDSDDFAGWLGYRCGITKREAREYMRVAETLRELPAIRAAFARGALTFTKVRALTRVATPASEEALLEIAGALTASQLERALRVYRRISTEEARETHELEFVSYHFDEDGSLYLRARLAAEDGTLVVKALDAAKDRVLERRREERAAAAREVPVDEDAALYTTAPERAASVEALVELADASLAESDEHLAEQARLVVHVDAAALASGGDGRSELEDGPAIAAETMRRLGCDAQLVTQIEQDGLPLSVGRTRRTVPPGLRRLLEARDDETCCFPGCERRRHLQAHHRRHWADGGETSLDNLVLLCFHHHRLVHEAGYQIEDHPASGLRFRNRHGVLVAMQPPRPPPGKADVLIAENDRLCLQIGPDTNRNGDTSRFDLGASVSAISNATGFAT